MNLFVPRKQNLTGVGKSSEVDAAHLEKALLENFLAIERWANQQSISACISQTTTHNYPNSGLQSATGPWTVLWDQYNLADTANDRIRVPESGIYTGFITGNLIPVAPAEFLGGGGALGYVSFIINGGSSFMTPSFLQIYDNGVTSLTTSSISFVGLGHLMGASVFSATTTGYITASVASNSTNFNAQITGWGIVRINNIPSKAQ